MIVRQATTVAFLGETASFAFFSDAGSIQSAVYQICIVGFNVFKRRKIGQALLLVIAEREAAEYRQIIIDVDGHSAFSHVGDDLRLHFGYFSQLALGEETQR